MATNEIWASFGKVAPWALPGLRGFVFDVQFTAMKLLFEPRQLMQYSAANAPGERP
jgi:hypothetical protein